MTNRSTLFVLAALAVLLPAAAQAATPMQGVPVQVRRGFYTETNLGTFFTLGGLGASPSNAQAYIGLGLGYDLIAKNKNLFSVGAAVTMGASAGACFGSDYVPGRTGETEGGSVVGPCMQGPEVLSDSWTATTLEASILYGREIASRLTGTVRAIGGYAFIQPLAFPGHPENLPVAGGGLGVEYATQFDHFSLGLDVAGKMFVGPNKLGIAVAPRIKYTF